MPRSLVESNGMLSCRGAANNRIDVGGIFTLLPLDDCWTVQEASSETVLDKQLMQFSQGRDRYLRHPQLHPGTRRGIEHPCRYDQDVPGSYLDVNDVPAGSPLDILSSKPAPIERVPAVMNLNFLPDMGRMTARLPLAARIICSPAPMPVAAAAAALYSLIETAKLNGLNPQQYLADVLARIGDHPARQIADLLPWRWKPAEPDRAAA